MPLTLYRRHRKSCAVHKLGLPPRAVRLWSECDCPIWMYGRTATTLYPRQRTGHYDMPAAEAFRASLDAKGKDERVYGPRLTDCVEAYLDSRKHELAVRTSDQHSLVLNRLAKFCADRNLFFIRDLDVDSIERFKMHGALADGSRKTHLATVICFLREALRRGWITDPIADKIRPHAHARETKAPYSDTEVRDILNGALNLSRGKGRFASHPETFRQLLELMLATGLRVGDAVRYDPRRAVKSEHLWIYSYSPQKSHRTKGQKIIEAYIPDSLKLAIDGCHWLSTELPFAFGSSSDTSYLSHEVYERMQTIGARIGIADCRPHRLRDTFAVRCLLRGVSLDDVSRLLGHSSVQVTEMYYAKWVPARGKRLERVVAQSLMNADGN